MYYYKNGIRYEAPDLTPEEQLAMQAAQAEAEAEYWRTIDYGDAVNTLIRERYTESQEFAIMRQRDEKPEEYAEYYTFCEECKDKVKEKKGMV